MPRSLPVRTVSQGKLKDQVRQCFANSVSSVLIAVYISEQVFYLTIQHGQTTHYYLNFDGPCFWRPFCCEILPGTGIYERVSAAAFGRGGNRCETG